MELAEYSLPVLSNQQQPAKHGGQQQLKQSSSISQKMPSGIINNTQLPPLQGGNAGASGYVMEGGMMRQVDEMDEDMAGMDEYGVSTKLTIK